MYPSYICYTCAHVMELNKHHDNDDFPLKYKKESVNLNLIFVNSLLKSFKPHKSANKFFSTSLRTYIHTYIHSKVGMSYAAKERKQANKSTGNKHPITSANGKG
ncbi:unnamed protein product [Ceratitis capitata]|uniref:(Mediterranean fruit fly) hypothetical protein n=1 Tax=Ceratitis capitata TaxID=7213 RepID=A0A811TWY2_CERCA|nr:unnamed protein product [Ceratitis capitata]